MVEELLFNSFIPTAVNIGVKAVLNKPLSLSIAEKKAWIKEKTEEISSVERVLEKNSKILNSETERQGRLVLSIKEIGYYEAIKRTVVASTIPHLRPERLREIEIPIIQNDKIIEITKLVREAFDLKNKRKPILKESDELFESYFC